MTTKAEITVIAIALAILVVLMAATHDHKMDECLKQLDNADRDCAQRHLNVDAEIAQACDRQYARACGVKLVNGVCQRQQPEQQPEQ